MRSDETLLHRGERPIQADKSPIPCVHAPALTAEHLLRGAKRSMRAVESPMRGGETSVRVGETSMRGGKTSVLAVSGLHAGR